MQSVKGALSVAGVVGSGGGGHLPSPVMGIWFSRRILTFSRGRNRPLLQKYTPRSIPYKKTGMFISKTFCLMGQDHQTLLIGSRLSHPRAATPPLCNPSLASGPSFKGSSPTENSLGEFRSWQPPWTFEILCTPLSLVYIHLPRQASCTSSHSFRILTGQKSNFLLRFLFSWLRQKKRWHQVQ